MCHDIKQLRLRRHTLHLTPIKSPQKAILFALMQKFLYLCGLNIQLWTEYKTFMLLRSKSMS